MPAGKENKNFNSALKIFGILEQNNFSRDSIIIALGGGVVGDLAGFIASTWLRGVKLIHIPTTLLAMVDSSIGGKTGINFRKTINGIGSYYHPILNLIDLNILDSISDRDFRSGMAEVIKCAIISDKKFFIYLTKNHNKILSRDQDALTYCINSAIEVKVKHVQGDVQESGIRLHLNYGHTLGHSIEISTEKDNKEQLRHGEGVSIGCIAAAFIADNFLLNNNTLEEYQHIFKLFQLPTFVDASQLGFDRNELIRECINNVKKDKKRIDTNLRLILSKRPGHAKVYNEVPFSLVEDAFKFIIR
jgi:3-dehydroquinate synthase